MYIASPVKKFLELQHARDFLLDPKQKEKYDKELWQERMAKRKQQEREEALDSQRRQMRDGALSCVLPCALLKMLCAYD